MSGLSHMKGIVTPTPSMDALPVYFSVYSHGPTTGKRSSVYNVDQVTDGDIRFYIYLDHGLTTKDTNVYLEFGDPDRPHFITMKESWRQGLLRARAMVLREAGVPPHLIDFEESRPVQMNQRAGDSPRSPPRGPKGWRQGFKPNNYIVRLILKRGIPGPIVRDSRRNVLQESSNEFGFEV